MALRRDESLPSYGKATGAEIGFIRCCEVNAGDPQRLALLQGVLMLNCKQPDDAEALMLWLYEYVWLRMTAEQRMELFLAGRARCEEEEEAL